MQTTDGTRRLILGAGAVVVAALLQAAQPARAALLGPIRTQSGPVTGVHSRWFRSVAVFKGIPYAAPPSAVCGFAPRIPPFPGRASGWRIGSGTSARSLRARPASVRR